METDWISFAGIVQDEREIEAVNRVLRTTWHTAGRECQALEDELSAYVGAKYCAVVNSGSSANLLALAALGLNRHDKVLTSGCGFPATLNPALHLGLDVELVDYELPSHNIDVAQVEERLSSDSSIKAIILAHTLGNPVDMSSLMAAANRAGVAVIEDCCEALGSKLHGRHVGTFCKAATLSFYSSHQINGLGFGGAVFSDDEGLIKEVRSMRAWGKKVRSASYGGDHITKYESDVDGIMYDDQYTYTTRGWNMQFSDVAAAYAREQLKKLPEFNERRRENYDVLRRRLSGLPLIEMAVLDGASPSYFGYPLTLAHGSRDDLAHALVAEKIKSRPFFAGNITRQPAYASMKKQLIVADRLMESSMFVGVWHGLRKEHVDRIAEAITKHLV